VGGVDASRRCVQLDLALTDAHAVAAKVTKPAVKTQQAPSTSASETYLLSRSPATQLCHARALPTLCHKNVWALPTGCSCRQKPLITNHLHQTSSDE
jgi:hypothetical protein